MRIEPNKKSKSAAIKFETTTYNNEATCIEDSQLKLRKEKSVLCYDTANVYLKLGLRILIKKTYGAKKVRFNLSKN